ncbi:MAG: hypothetical protein ACYCQJ_05595 [Nitrososphaerales archaeon]
MHPNQVVRKARALRAYFEPIPQAKESPNRAHSIELQAERRAEEILIQLKEGWQASNECTESKEEELNYS